MNINLPNMPFSLSLVWSCVKKMKTQKRAKTELFTSVFVYTFLFWQYLVFFFLPDVEAREHQTWKPLMDFRPKLGDRLTYPTTSSDQQVADALGRRQQKEEMGDQGATARLPSSDFGFLCFFSNDVMCVVQPTSLRLGSSVLCPMRGCNNDNNDSFSRRDDASVCYMGTKVFS